VIDAEALGLEPGCDGVDVLLRNSVLLPLFGSTKPLTEVRRRFISEGVDEGFEGGFDFGSALQLQEHVIERKSVGDTAAFVLGIGLRTRVAVELGEPGVVDGLGNEGSRSLGRSQDGRTKTRNEKHK